MHRDTGSGYPNKTVYIVGIGKIKQTNNGTFNNSHRRGTYPNLNFWIRFMIKVDIIF